MSILNVNVNWFLNHSSQHSPESVNLQTWLTSDLYYDRQLEIIGCEDASTKQKLKAEMPAITPSLHYGEHTGLLAIDIDGKDNPNRPMEDIRAELERIDQIAYCGQSVSGKGLWAVIPIAYPEKHLYHFKALERIFKNRGIIIDPACKNVNRLRYYAYDPRGYFNPEAEPFTQILEPPSYERRRWANVVTGWTLGDQAKTLASLEMFAFQIVYSTALRHPLNLNPGGDMLQFLC
jgi:hypothetical protein